MAEKAKMVWMAPLIGVTLTPGMNKYSAIAPKDTMRHPVAAKWQMCLAFERIRGPVYTR